MSGQLDMMRLFSQRVHIVFTTNPYIAQKYVEENFEPIEWSFGEITLVGEYMLDHHGKYSDMPSVAIRGQGELFRKGKHKYIINHIDADIIVAIAGLEGIRIPKALTELIAEIDVKGKHRVNWHNSPYRGRLVMLWEYLKSHSSSLQSSSSSPSSAAITVTAIIATAIYILINDIDDYKDKYDEYIKTVEKDIALIQRIDTFIMPIARRLPSIGQIRIALAVGDSTIGFEAWYTKADIVVAYSPNRGKVTVGAVDEDIARQVFGSEHGLLEFASVLGQGWGGRPTIIGSPRDKFLTREDAELVYQKLKETLLSLSSREASK
ncbi:MAG: hypothetical protein QW475_04525 [Candidatus Nitrosocaldus sp.]